MVSIWFLCNYAETKLNNTPKPPLYLCSQKTNFKHMKIVNTTSLADALAQFCEHLTSTITHQVTESVREQLRADRESREDGQTPKFLTVDEYCAQFHISKATFHRMVKRGQIKVIKKGRRTLIPADSM